MTNFPPETYLAAARIYDPQPAWRIQNFMNEYYITYLTEEEFMTTNGLGRETCRFIPELNYRQRWHLREALDKEYGVKIEWDHHENKWFSECIRPMFGAPIPPMFDDDITTLMLRNVAALVEAGVVE